MCETLRGGILIVALQSNHKKEEILPILENLFFFCDPARQIYDNITVYGRGLKDCGVPILKLTIGFTLTFIITAIASIAGVEMIASADDET